MQNTRLYLVKVNRYPREKQIEDCLAAIERLDLPVLGDSIYEHRELDHFIKDLRKDELAIVPRLEGLAAGKGRGVGRRFLINVNRVCSTSLAILDLDTGISSDDGQQWQDLLEQVFSKLSRGRKLDKERASSMGIKRHEVEPGLVEAWKRKEGDADYLAAAVIWGNLAIKPAEVAIEMLPDDELRAASKATIQRIFKSRAECEQWLKKRNQ